MNIRKFFSTTARALLSLAVLSTPAFAGADDYNPYSDNQPYQQHQLQQHQDQYYQQSYQQHQGQYYQQSYQSYQQSDCQQPCGQSYCMSNCCGTPCCPPPCCGVAFNPPAYCRCSEPSCCCDSYGFSIDLLWWKANVGGIALGSEEQIGMLPIIDGEDIFNTSHVKKPDFRFDPGFRIAITDYCICDCWDAALAWTHYHTTARAHGSSTNGGSQPLTAFISYWERIPGDFLPAQSKSRYALNLDLLDLEFGRKYFVSSCFVLRPFFGLRGARINQSYKVQSQSLVFHTGTPNDEAFASTSVLSPDFTSAVKAKNNYLAIGPRIGLDAQVHLGCGFSIVGQAGGSIVYGSFKRNSSEDISISKIKAPTGAGPLVVNSEITNFSYETNTPTDCSSRAFTDLAIGLRWERCMDWCNHVHPIGLEFTWEHHGFYNVTNFDFESSATNLFDLVTPSVPKKVGDIFTQGLTASLTVGF